MIRDAEVENIIRTYATPVFEAAGLNAKDVDIYLIDDPVLNSFVAGGMNIFVHTGLIIKSKTPNQLIGVLAHETGHIADGHIARFTAHMEDLSKAALIAAILGTAGAVAGGGNAAMGGVLGSQAAAQNALMSYSRTQESAADQAALSFLDRAHESARGLSEFFHYLEGEELLSSTRQDEYLRTHPLTQDRIQAVDAHVARSPYSNVKDSPELMDLHQRMVAKLFAFLNAPSTTLVKYPESDKSIYARYARAIAYYKIPDLAHALPLIDGLIADEPNNPYFYELKGQMLFENARSAEAVAPYQKAVSLLPDAPLLRIELAQVLLERNDPKLVKPAIDNLQMATRRETTNAFAWDQLAIGYGRDGQYGMSALASAEASMARNDKRGARTYVARAEKDLPRGSPGWLRAQDIKDAARPTRDER
ncbi:MAG TPA: M48 family metalloprotease [Alphaproteobacteria bacterium]|jgi:predicted Zn-dependent protease|nr:M48 family metalloprotease [Alphaproteobacteria bacterium]